jgi:ribosomal protein S18 acetylase RimI-like enzyme
MPEIRPFTASDVSAIKLLLAQLQAVEAAHQPRRKSAPEVAAEEIWAEGQKMVNEGKGVVLVAEQGGVLVGVGIGYESLSGDLSLTLEARRTGYVSDLVVHEAWRSKGIGRDLLNGLLARFHARGLKTARIGAITENAGAIKLYEQMGFNQVSVALERPL